MPLQRQLPKLCLRGSIANITMANLTAQEQDKINDLTIKIANHPELQPKRMSIIRSYATTVGGDYRDDHTIADEEFIIAIWRGVVNLFYHRKYSYRCKACGSAHYCTKRNRPAAIDRQKLVCPNCNQIEVTDAGGSAMLSVGQFLPYSDFKSIAADFPDAAAPKCKSPIEYIPCDRAYNNPEEILKDNTQIRKFFGEYAWNYCRQQIRENARAEHKKKPKTIMGRADEVIHQELISLCRKMRLDFSHNVDRYSDTSFDVIVTGLFTPPEFTAELALLRKRALLHSVTIKTDRFGISVLKNDNAEIISGKVIAPEHVMYQEECSEDDENGFTIGRIYYRTSRGERMEPDDHVAQIENEDVLGAIRSELPDGVCKAVFDIYCGRGEVYRQFSDEFGDGPPKKCQIGQFLQTPHRTVGQCKQTIKIISLKNGLHPR